MASVHRIRDRKGKQLRAWRFKYRDHSGRWRYGTGWPDKRKTLDHALALEAECRAIRKGEKAVPPSWLRERNRPIADVVAEYLEWGRAQGDLRTRGSSGSRPARPGVFSALTARRRASSSVPRGGGPPGIRSERHMSTR